MSYAAFTSGACKIKHTRKTYIIMKNRILRYAALCLSLLCGTQTLHAQDNAAETPPRFLFRFVEGDDMFYVPYNGNGSRLDSLCLMLVPEEIGEGAVGVDGYSATRSLSMIRCNRVKSELILRCGMRERHFTTTNNAGTFNGMHNVVVVTLPAAKEEVCCWDEEWCPDLPVVEEEPLPELPCKEEVPFDVVVPLQPEEQCSVPQQAAVQPVPVRWSVGVNVGVPFLWGDMVSVAYDKTYVGIAAGVQGSYRFSHLLGVTVSADYARGRAGARGYSAGYAISPDGMTSYVSQTASAVYGDLYSQISVVNAGVSLDVNLNRIFSREAFRHRFTVWVSPTVYGQFFDSRLFAKADGSQFSDGSLRPAKVSLGLGGALTLRYRIGGCLELQLKNSLVWIADNNFDAVATPYGKARQNAMWTPQVGIVWNIK